MRQFLKYLFGMCATLCLHRKVTVLPKWCKYDWQCQNCGLNGNGKPPWSRRKRRKSQ